MKIAIGICTKDNQLYLSMCLRALLLQKVSCRRVRIYIIDSSSNPASTKAVIRSVRKLNPNFIFEYYYQKKQGIVFARNLLFQVAQEHWLFSIDDDVIPAKNWLNNGCNFFARNPNIDIIGGKILPHKSLPAKFKELLFNLGLENSCWPFTILDLGDNPKRMVDFEDYPLFANMGIRKKVYKKYKLDESFANQSAFFKIYGGEDPDFIERARKTATIFYVPSMLSFHQIKPFKKVFSYFYWRYWENGKEQAMLHRVHNINRKYSRQFLNILLSRKSYSTLSKIRATSILVLFYVSYFFHKAIYFFVKRKDYGFVN